MNSLGAEGQKAAVDTLTLKHHSPSMSQLTCTTTQLFGTRPFALSRSLHSTRLNTDPVLFANLAHSKVFLSQSAQKSEGAQDWHISCRVAAPTTSPHTQSLKKKGGGIRCRLLNNSAINTPATVIFICCVQGTTALSLHRLI